MVSGALTVTLGIKTDHITQERALNSRPDEVSDQDIHLVGWPCIFGQNELLTSPNKACKSTAFDKILGHKGQKRPCFEP